MNFARLLLLARVSYRLLLAAAGSLQSPFLLIVRFYWGWSFFQTGKGKLVNHDQVTEFFTSLHLPWPGLNAYLAGATECFGGLLLLLGLASRLAATPLILTMIVAYLTADLEAVKNLFADPGKFTAADPFLFLLASVIVLAFGPGAFSLDRLLARKFGFCLEPALGPVANQRSNSEPFVRQEVRAAAN